MLESLPGSFYKLLSLDLEWQRVNFCFLPPFGSKKMNPNMKSNMSHQDKFSIVLQHGEYTLTLASTSKCHLNEASKVTEHTFPLVLTRQGKGQQTDYESEF